VSLPIYPCSDKARPFVLKIDNSTEILERKGERHRLYPFPEMPLGYSFAVPYSPSKYKSVAVTASVMGKKLNRRFKIIRHKELDVVEVVRIA